VEVNYAISENINEVFFENVSKKDAQPQVRF